MSAIVPRVGRHTVPDAPPPPKAKPPYRFLLAMGAIVILAVVAMAVVAAVYPERGPAAADSGQDSTTVELSPPPQTPPDAVPPAPGQPTQPAQTQPPAPTTTSLPRTQGAVVGSYAMTHTDGEWGNKFEARVSLTNTSGTPQPWVVTLEYPTRVDSFAAVWVDPGQPPPGQIVNQPLFTVTGNQPIPAGATITVWMQFSVGPGAPVTLLDCRVNGSACQRS